MKGTSSTAFFDIGTGPALLLLHGFPFNRSMWREQIEFFSTRGYRCVAPDLRGLGENVAQSDAESHSLSSVSPATMEEMARDVAALMDELKIDRAVMCGLSMGGYVAFEFVSLFPDRVSALVLCGPKAQGPDNAEKISREAQAQRALSEGMSFAVESISAKLLAQKTVSERPDVVERVSEMVLSTDPRGAAAAQLGMAARRDYSRDLADIKVPTLIIAGREDRVRTPEDAEFIQRGIRGTRLLTMEAAGHLMNLEQPEIFNHELLRFLHGAH